MDKTLEVAIKGKVDASVAASFKTVTDGATKMSSAVTTSAKQSAAALRDNKKAADDLKIGAAALATGFTLAARSNEQQKRSIDALMRSYGDAGREIVDFTNAIEDQTNFSDEAARAAAAYGATLVNEYGLSLQQVEELLKRSADLAEQRGLSFEDASQRVTAAVRGEAEGVEILGAAVGDQALHLDQMSKSTSDAEKAQIRFNAIMEQTASAAGTAQRASEGTRGAVIDLAQGAGDAAQAFADWTGPIGEAAAGLSDYALQAGLAVGGLAKLGSGLKEVGAGTKVAQLGSAALSLAMGPAGLVAAAGLAAVALYKSAESADKAHFSFDEATSSIEGTSQAIGALVQAGAPLGAINSLREYAGAWDEVKLAAGQADSELQGLYEERATYLTRIEVMENSLKNSTLDLTQAQRDQTEKLIADAKATQAAIDLQIAAKERLILTDKEAIEVSKAIADITDDYAQSNYPALLERLNQILDDGTMSSKAKAEAILDLQAHEDDYGLSIAQTTSRLDEQTLAENNRAAGRKTAEQDMTRAAIAERNYADALHQTAIMSSVLANQEARRIQHDYEGDQEKIDAYNLSLEEQRVETIAAADAQNRWRPQIEANAEAIELQKQRLQEAADAARGYAEALIGTSSLAAQLRPMDISVSGGDKVTGTAADLQSAGAGLDSVLGIFGTIEQMGQQSGQAGSIAEKLIGKPGEISTLTTLLDEQRISQTRYNMTLEAGNAIIGRNSEVQSDLAVIQAKQLPFLDQASEQYSTLIDDISHMTTEQAAATLGFMDSGLAMQANNALALAAAAANTEVGSTARQAAEASIEGAIASQPYLEEMLTSIGLVARDHKGNLVVNFDNADALNESTDALTDAILESVCEVMTARGGGASGRSWRDG